MVRGIVVFASNILYNNSEEAKLDVINGVVHDSLHKAKAMNTTLDRVVKAMNMICFSEICKTTMDDDVGGVNGARLRS